MSDLTDELERKFASAEQEPQSEPTEQSNINEEQPRSQEPAVIDEWMDAPKSYTKEYQDTFKELSPKWREYLIGREKQVERGFSDLGNKVNGYKWVDDIYSTRQDRLGQMGIAKAQDYIRNLADIDDAMVKDPRATLMALANAYGVDFNNNNNAYDSLQKQFFDLQQNVKNTQDWIAQAQQQKVSQEFNDFTNAKDEQGNLKHQYLEDVRQDMANLIKSGVCSNLEDAYNNAIWMSPTVRDKMLKAQQQADLNSKIAEANKAKEASFSPTAKATEATKDLSTREILEQKFSGVE